ncbi:EAL domain-containing protein [Candidatus Reidiella endopervernicosa]|uniref:EAL domain-containing protein n=1 Tax=Candidatus Reidiella endopervernicosa TaxID=2738883 RepID=A0A6N0HTZ2_9GAMM|nr:EAL domain-containing protein [Candidatus Reidiella endopervernicosa]QKQ25855.1 EAL domain-containing protein [Candidatus Reidiella endopervernicosa]
MRQSQGCVSINISGQSLGDGAFLDFVVDEIHAKKVDTELVCFEITETAAISDFTNALKFINTLKGYGCKFALDDFGSGLSSFGYLKNLPIDFIKIDGMFVKDILDDPVDLVLVEAITKVAHEIGVPTIAEFVENEAIEQKLKQIGVDYAQGYHIGYPEPWELD